MAVSTFIRVCAASLALTTLSFAAGVAGDLSSPPPAHGVAVVVRIPPQLPVDTPRAAPLPPLRTSAAEALPVERRPIEALEPELGALMTEHELVHSIPETALVLESETQQLG